MGRAPVLVRTPEVATSPQLDRVLLAQVAQAVHDQALIDLAESCRSETERQLTWAQGKLEEAAPQALVTP